VVEYTAFPMFGLNVVFLVTMTVYICSRRTKLWEANTLTKIQFTFLVLTTLLSSTLLALFIYT